MVGPPFDNPRYPRAMKFLVIHFRKTMNPALNRELEKRGIEPTPPAMELSRAEGSGLCA